MGRRAAIAEEIRVELARQGKTASQLSTSAGIKRDTLRRRLNGIYPFTAEELIRICDVLGLNIQTLADRTEDAA